MKKVYSILLLVSLFFSPVFCYAQDSDDEDGSGKLGKLAGSYEDEDDSKKKNETESRDSFFAFLIEDLVGHAITNMRPGPYPYNGATANFSPSDPYPGGILHVQSSYFRHNEALFGLLWRFNYYYQRFGIDADLFNLIEDVGDEYDYLNLAAGRISWDFIGKADFRLSGQVGVRNLSYGRLSKTGPELGFRFVGLPKKPFIVEGNGSVARLSGRQFSTLSGTFGILIKRVHLFVGGQIIRSSEIAIDGFKIGARIWL